MTLATLAEAIDWVEARWHGQRPAPMRLHSRGTEGAFTVSGNEESYTGGSGERLGSPPFSPAFMSALTGSAAATMTITLRTIDETGQELTRDVDRFRYPMTRALDRLAKVPNSKYQTHPYALVVWLAEAGWDPSRVVVSDIISQADLLRAIRQLHSRYEEGPTGRPSWIDKSESQRAAESVPA